MLAGPVQNGAERVLVEVVLRSVREDGRQRRVLDLRSSAEERGSGMRSFHAYILSRLRPLLLERETEILHCIACAQGCFDNLFKLKPVECLCNPKAGHEKDSAVEKTTMPKKVMVVGGGAAGMSAALSAREKGHLVTLYEKSDRLGGQLYLAAAPPGREEFAELAGNILGSTYMNGTTIRLDGAVRLAPK